MFGRAKFFSGYARAAEDRVPGFKITLLALMMLLLLSVGGVLNLLIRQYTGVHLVKYGQDIIGL